MDRLAEGVEVLGGKKIAGQLLCGADQLEQILFRLLVDIFQDLSQHEIHCTKLQLLFFCQIKTHPFGNEI